MRLQKLGLALVLMLATACGAGGKGSTLLPSLVPDNPEAQGLAPKFVNQPGTVNIMEPNSTLDLSVTVNAQPEANISWSLNGNIVAANQTSLSVVYDESVFGEYTVVATNEHGSAQIVFQVRGEADVVEVGDCALNETASSYLFSIPVTGLSNASFAWMKNAVPYQGDNFILSVAKDSVVDGDLFSVEVSGSAGTFSRICPSIVKTDGNPGNQDEPDAPGGATCGETDNIEHELFNAQKTGSLFSVALKESDVISYFEVDHQHPDCQMTGTNKAEIFLIRKSSNKCKINPLKGIDAVFFDSSASEYSVYRVGTELNFIPLANGPEIKIAIGGESAVFIVFGDGRSGYAFIDKQSVKLTFGGLQVATGGVFHTANYYTQPGSLVDLNSVDIINPYDFFKLQCSEQSKAD